MHWKNKGGWGVSRVNKLASFDIFVDQMKKKDAPSASASAVASATGIGGGGGGGASNTACCGLEWRHACTGPRAPCSCRRRSRLRSLR